MDFVRPVHHRGHRYLARYRFVFSIDHFLINAALMRSIGAWHWRTSMCIIHLKYTHYRHPNHANEYCHRSEADGRGAEAFRSADEASGRRGLSEVAHPN